MNKKTVLLLVFVIFINFFAIAELSYPIVDTNQTKFFGNSSEISTPAENEDFFGQDGSYSGLQPNYQDNGDGTITDLNTGLMWQKKPDFDNDGDIDYDDKMTYDEAISYAEGFSLAGYDDWRLPSIKELYSLIIFSGIDPSGWEGEDASQLTPFIDTNYFDFAYGDTNAGERIIDAQFASSTLYVGTTMNDATTMFGVNFADGRIKGYPKDEMTDKRRGKVGAKKFFVLYVRGNNEYGVNDFQDNDNGTITDNSTGLMWMQNDNGTALTWQEALNYAENFEYAGYSDWRLPNAKELQSIVDYTRSPSTTNSAAIDPIFNSTQITDEGGNSNYPFYWSGTTHENWSIDSGKNAAYVSFGEALGWMEMPPMSGNYTLMDVHGAGAQRSDPKIGDPDDYPYGHGPQGDVIRIYNYVRLVRDTTGDVGFNDENLPKEWRVSNSPNPFNPDTIINYSVPEDSNIKIEVFNILGQKLITLVDKYEKIGDYKVAWDGKDENAYAVSSGVYFYKIISDGALKKIGKMLLVK